MTDVTYSEWQYKNIKNTETKLKSKCFQIQWVYSFCVFFFNPSELLLGYKIIIYYEYFHIVYLYHLHGVTIKKYKKSETKLKSKSFQIQWVYSFFVFFFNPSELLLGYKIIIYYEYVHIVYLYHLHRVTIKKYKKSETKLKSKSFEIQWVYSFIVFFFNPSELLWRYRTNVYYWCSFSESHPKFIDDRMYTIRHKTLFFKKRLHIVNTPVIFYGIRLFLIKWHWHPLRCQQAQCTTDSSVISLCFFLLTYVTRSYRHDCHMIISMGYRTMFSFKPIYVALRYTRNIKHCENIIVHYRYAIVCDIVLEIPRNIIVIANVKYNVGRNKNV